MPNLAPDYTLCADDNSVLLALHDLSMSSIVIFDCEGDALGREGGSLSIVALRAYGTTGPPGTYLIDVLSISPAILERVITFIGAPTPLKVVFDGRMDFTEIYFTWKARPSSGAVLDLTLLELSSRNDDEASEIQRLLSVFRPGAAYAQRRKKRNDPSKVGVLIGLERCIKERNILADVPNLKVDHTAWLNRPLSQTQLEYAAMDTLLIEKLYLHLYTGGYIPAQGSSPTLRRTQKSKSHRFVTMWMDVRKPPRGNVYFGNGLLPMGIIDPIPLTSKTRQCEGCQRQLLPAAFSQGGRTCHICAILPKTRFWKSMSSQSPKPVSNSQNNSGPLSHSAPAVSNPQPTLECIPAPKLNYTPPPKPASHSREPNALGTQNSSATKLVKSVVPKAQDLGSSSMVQPKGAPNPSKTKAPNSQKTGMAMSQKSGATKPKKSSAKKSQKSNVTKSLQSGTTKSQTTDTSKSQKGVKPNTQTTKG